jgi:hypothetical protein
MLMLQIDEEGHNRAIQYLYCYGMDFRDWGE